MWTLLCRALVASFVLLVLGFFHSAKAQADGEMLLQTAPAHFKIGFQTSRSRPEMKMTEMIPDSETVDDWSEMITTQIFPRLAGVRPGDFLRSIGGKWLVRCPSSTHSDINNGNANAYPVSMLMLSCPNDQKTGKPETVLLRAIQGTKGLYLVQYAFRQREAPDLLSKAAQYLGTVNVCDSQKAEHPYPDIKAQD